MKIVEYLLEGLKFLSIYVLGYGMPVTKKGYRILLAVITAVVMGVYIECMGVTDYFPVVYIGFSIVFSCLVIQKFSWKNISIFLWPIGIILSVDMITYIIVKILCKDIAWVTQSEMGILSDILTIVALSFVFFWLKRKYQYILRKLPFGYYIGFLVVCFINAIVLTILQNTLMKEYFKYSIFYLFMAVSAFFEMGLVLVLASSNRLYRENQRLQEEYLKVQDAHYHYLEEKDREIKRFRHDIRHHLLVIRQQLVSGENAEAEKYITTLSGKLEHPIGYVSVKNGIVDAILNYYAKQFEKENISLRIAGNMPQNCQVEAFDLCTIFSNLLQNALEATVRSEEKYIELSIRFEEDMIFIRERNSFCGELQWNGDEILTSKRERESHGFGLINLKESVRKYEGSTLCRAEGQEFILEIMLKNGG